MGALETGVLCRSAGPASALERASESGPNMAAVTNKASNAATVPTLIRGAGSTIRQPRLSVERAKADARSISVPPRQEISAGASSSQVSTTARPLAVTPNDSPVSTRWSARSPSRVSQTRPRRTSRRPPAEPSGTTWPERKVWSAPAATRPSAAAMVCVFIIDLLL